MITTTLNGSLGNASYRRQYPTTCPGVPGETLSSRETWKDDVGFYKMANSLAVRFQENSKKLEDFANDEIMEGAPKKNRKYV